MSQENTREGAQSGQGKKNPVKIETVAKAANSASNGRYSAAVPISLYRELTTELESTKKQLSILSRENDKLKHQNRLLQQEVRVLLRSTPVAKNVNHSFLIEPRQSGAPLVDRLERKNSEIAIEKTAEITSKIDSNSLQIETNKPEWIEETKIEFPAAVKVDRGANGWLLALAIFLIVGTAFTAGFLLVRPLIDSNGD